MNYRGLALILVIVTLLGTGSHFLRGFQVRRNASALLAHADRAEEEASEPGIDRAARGEKRQESLEYLQRYLGFVPGNADVRARAALLQTDLARSYRERAAARDALELALQKAPERIDLRRKAIEINRTLGLPTEARVHLADLVRVFPKDAALAEQLGEVEEADKRYTQAAREYARATELDPQRVSSYVARAYVLRRHLNDPEQADEVIEEMLRVAGKRPEAQLARVRYHKEFKAGTPLDDTQKVLGGLVERLADNPDVLLLAAEMEFNRGAEAQATSYLRRGLRLHPTDARFYQELARIELRAGRRAEAGKLLRRSLEHAPEAIFLLWSTADLLVDAGEPEEARKLVSRINRDELTSGLLDYVEARVETAKGRWLQAAELLERAQQELARIPALRKQAHVLLGRCHARIGNPDRQLASCRAALDIDPTWLPALRAQAEAVWAMGRTDEALTLFNQLVPRWAGARLAAARLWVIRNNRLPPDKRSWETAEDLLAQTPPELRKTADWFTTRTELYAAQGKFAEAHKAVEAGLAQYPRDLPLWLGRAALAQLQGRSASVPGILDAAEKVLGDRADIRLARVRHLLVNNKTKEAQALLARLDATSSRLPEADRITWLNALASFHLDRGDVGAAQTALERQAAQEKRDLRSRLLLLDLYLAGNNEKGIARVIRELREIEGLEGVFWRYAEAVQLLRKKESARPQRDQARKLLDEARKRRDSWPRLFVLRGMIEEADGNLAVAIQQYRRAIDLGEGRPDVIRRLVTLYHRQQRYEDARDLLARMRELAPGSNELNRLAAAISLARQDQGESTLELARAAVPASSRDYRDHLWLGQVLAALQKPAEAEKSLRKAIELAKTVAEPRIALVQLLASTGRAKEAQTEVALAQKALPREQAALALAFCWEVLGKRQQAEKSYQAALTARSSDLDVRRMVALFHLRGGEWSKAEGHLRKIMSDGDLASAIWARRTLALALASTGDYKQYREAIALLDKNLEESASSADQRARALVLAQQPTGRREAIRTLEASFVQEPPTPSEQLLIAKLYAAERDWRRWRERMLALFSGKGDPNPEYLAYYIETQIRRGEKEDASSWVGTLEKREPDSLRAVTVRARLLHAYNQQAQATARLKEFVAAGPADLNRKLAVARLLDELGASESAEPLYRAYAKALQDRQPQAVLPLIEHLTKRNRLTEALNLCEYLRSRVAPESVAFVSIAVLRGGKPEPQHYRRVERWLTADLNKKSTSHSAALALANLRDLDGKVEEAERIYRQVLKQDDRNVLAYNNLAVLLALRTQRAAEALVLIERAIEIAGPLPMLLDTRGTVYLESNQADKAVQDLQKATELSGDAGSYYRLARAHFLLRDRQSAQTALRRAEDAGLKISDLHSLEHVAYRRLLHDLKN
jgi:tetratricopeptide (TPR) repeat protein